MSFPNSCSPPRLMNSSSRDVPRSTTSLAQIPSCMNTANADADVCVREDSSTGWSPLAPTTRRLQVFAVKPVCKTKSDPGDYDSSLRAFHLLTTFAKAFESSSRCIAFLMVCSAVTVLSPFLPLTPELSLMYCPEPLILKPLIIFDVIREYSDCHVSLWSARRIYRAARRSFLLYR